MRHQQIRQGDVLLQPVTRRTRSGTAVPLDHGRVILAYGEVTGHAHVVLADDVTATPDVPPAALFEEPGGTRYLFVDRPCALVHDEHARITLTPGCYRVVRQREYSPDAIRQVAD